MSKPAQVPQSALRPLPDGRMAFACPWCRAVLAVPVGAELAGPCPYCRCGIHLEGAGRTPVPAVAAANGGMQGGVEMSDATGGGHYGVFLVSGLGLIGLVMAAFFWLPGPIDQVLRDMGLVERVSQISESSAGEAGRENPVADGKDLAGEPMDVLREFLEAKGPVERSAMTAEGPEMRGVLLELEGPDGALADGYPPAMDFLPAGEGDLPGVSMGAESRLYLATTKPESKGRRAVMVAVGMRRLDDGQWRISGRLLHEVAVRRFGEFLERSLDPNAELELLVRMRRRVSVEQVYAVDPMVPEVEILPPFGEEPAGSAAVESGTPAGKMLAGLVVGETRLATAMLAKVPEGKNRLRFVGLPRPGWDGLFADEAPADGSRDGVGEVSPVAAVLESKRVLEKFLTEKSDGRLAYVHGQDGPRLMRELIESLGEPPAAGTVIEEVPVLPRSLEKTGARAFHLVAEPVDGPGTVVAYMVPVMGGWKLDGPLLAQSYYGWFRRFAAKPSGVARELRGVVSRDPAMDGPTDFRFRDVHGETSIRLSLPLDSRQAGPLQMLGAGEARHATLRLRWEGGDAGGQPRIVLDEWLCWGYQGIDDQTF